MSSFKGVKVIKRNSVDKQRSRRRLSVRFLLCLFLGLASTAMILAVTHIQGRVLMEAHVDYSFEPPRILEWHLMKKEPAAVTSTDVSATVESMAAEATEETKVTISSIDKETKVANLSNSGCLKHNSKEWLSSPRLGNNNETLMTDDFVRQMILDLPFALQKPGIAKTFLQQTVAHEQSRFVNDTEAGTDPKSMRMWSVRMIYLSMMLHQHQHAAKEAEARFSNDNCQAELDKYQIGRFDYECPDTKYIIGSLSGNGLGINVRGGTSTLLIAGLISNRTVLFVSNSPTGHKRMQIPWKLASCDRHDSQCFFMPTSPCVPTLKDIEEAYELPRPERRKLFKRGEFPAEHKDDKVWYLPMDFVPNHVRHRRMDVALHQYANELISHVAQDDPRLPALKLAVDHLLDKDEPRPGYNFAAANLKVNHALGFYTMRPNLESARKLNETMREIVPGGLNPETAFGLPIRASDKCNGESECLSFTQYLTAVTQVWQKHQAATGAASNPTVVFTTESKQIVSDQQAFAANETLQKKLPLNFTFVTNHKDVTPDTGLIREVSHKMSFTEDENMLSVIASLKLQLFPRHSIGNCCSNFHVLLQDFLVEGLGAASENNFQCMQEFEDPELQICCGWHHDCKANKAVALAVLQNKSESAAALQ